MANPSGCLTACQLVYSIVVAATLFAGVGSLCSFPLSRICSEGAPCCIDGGCQLSLAQIPWLVVRNLMRLLVSQLFDEHPQRSIELGLCLQTDTEEDLFAPECFQVWQRHYCAGPGYRRTYSDFRYSPSCLACCEDCSLGCPCEHNADSGRFDRCQAS